MYQSTQFLMSYCYQSISKEYLDVGIRPLDVAFLFLDLLISWCAFTGVQSSGTG